MRITMQQVTPASPSAPSQPAAAQRDDDITPSLLPIRREDFGAAQARHLLWRAGFGGTDSQINRLVAWGPEKSVDTLLGFMDAHKPGGSGAFDPIAADRFDRDIMRPLTDEERREQRRAQQAQDEDTLAKFREARQERERLDRAQVAEMQKWWLTRMIETRHPMEEKLTLFWHGHFATNYRVIENSYHMFMQNQLFRKHAAGNFGELLAGIIRDPAMIAYLDNNDSRKGQANENLAREIMELFALGIGNYSEDDIKEGAKALTGYTFDDDQFVFRRTNHDNSEKTILGKTGTWDGDDFVKLILSKKACARYIMRRMYHYLVADVPPDERGGDKELDPAQRKVLRELGDMLYSRTYDLRPVLRRLLLSKHFYDATIMGQQIKSPVQLVVGAVRSLNTPVRDLSILNDALDLMGQRIFLPPSVKGWVGGRTWVNTSTLFVRQNIMAFLIAGKKPQGYDPSANTDRFDTDALFAGVPEASAVGRREPAAVAMHLLNLTLGSAPDHAVGALKAFMQSRNNRIDQETLVGCLLLITAMPEYQLC
jgi:uncharacterized protein (DUF1800 family)